MPDVHLLGLPGPLHGATGDAPANPRAAVTQVIGLMRALTRIGVPVAVLPPLLRPDAAILRTVGFAGDEATVAAAAALRAPELHRIACTDAADRTSSLATCIPAEDAFDGRIHLVAANHAGGDGQVDAALRTRQLRALFPDKARVVIHDPLPAIAALADAGGVNHHRIATGDRSCHVLVEAPGSRLRQTRAASDAIARICGLAEPIHVGLSPAAMAAGAVAGESVLCASRDRILIHESAWTGQTAALEELRRRVDGVRTAVVRESELPLAEAVLSRLFASCLVRAATGHVLVCSSGCRLGPARPVLDRLLADGFVGGIEHVELDAALPAGAGPANLRLRILVPAEAASAIHPGIVCDQRRLDTLDAWARSTYRERMTADDLGDPQVLEEARSALDLLSRLLGLPAGFYAPPGVRQDSSSTIAVR